MTSVHFNTIILAPGYPTGIPDTSGTIIRLGDICKHDNLDKHSLFEVIYENDTFRRKYKKWDKSAYPLLSKKPITPAGVTLHYIIVKPATLEPSHLLPHHVTPKKFAAMIGRSRTAVYTAINDGLITVDYIGMEKDIPMIDYEKYKDVKFKRSPPKTG